MNRDSEQAFAEIYKQRHLSIMAEVNIKERARNDYFKSTNFAEKYSDIWDIEKRKSKHDTRTSKQIIDDTTKAMGIKVIKRRR